MKSERRHELKTNTLANRLEELPNFWRQYGSRLILVVLLVLLVIAIVEIRANNAQKQRLAASEQLTVVRRNILYLQIRDNLIDRVPPEELAAFRGQYIADATNALEVIQQAAGYVDAATNAEALLARGDLYWTEANLVELPGSTTRPSLNLSRAPENLLDDAESAYKKVVSDYPDQSDAVQAARMGLGAIAENRSHWDEATADYQAIVDDKSAAATFHDQAAARIKQVEIWKATPHPLIVESDFQPTRATQPTSQSTYGPTPLSGIFAPTTAPSSTPPLTMFPTAATPLLNLTTQPATQP
jgi:hypothetical protein